jgi:hypothetical protein
VNIWEDRVGLDELAPTVTVQHPGRRKKQGKAPLKRRRWSGTLYGPLGHVSRPDQITPARRLMTKARTTTLKKNASTPCASATRRSL